jgi:hypothetical protein
MSTSKLNQAESNRGAALRLWLEQTFDHEDAARLYDRCKHGGSTPLGASHPIVILELAGVEIGSQVMPTINIAYMLLTAYYFLLDSGTDGHPECPVDLADLTLLLSGAWAALIDVMGTLDDHRSDRMVECCLARMAENAAAIRLEADQIESWQARDEIDSRRSSIGRSNSALLLYELMCVTGGRERDPQVVAILEEYLAVIQESDDLDDWREDMCAGRWTPFLKRCAESGGDEPTLGAITRQVYLGGEYERQAARVIQGLNGVETDLARHLGNGPVRVLAWWAKQRMVRERALAEWVATKLRYA